MRLTFISTVLLAVILSTSVHTEPVVDLDGTAEQKRISIGILESAFRCARESGVVSVSRTLYEQNNYLHIISTSHSLFSRPPNPVKVETKHKIIDIRALSRAVTHNDSFIAFECKRDRCAFDDKEKEVFDLMHYLCDQFAADNAVLATNSLIELLEQKSKTIPEDHTAWDHNGSRVALIADEARREFRFLDPRKGLVDVGVMRGDLLFEGSLNTAGEVSGDAFVYSRQCGPAKYAVKGRTNDAGALVLEGNAPRRDSRCRTVATRPDRMTFNLSEQQ